jgi:hypothetical protein
MDDGGQLGGKKLSGGLLTIKMVPSEMRKKRPTAASIAMAASTFDMARRRIL